MITIDPQTESKLREVLGQDINRIAREALIAEAYRTGKLSMGQVARLLDLPINEAYGFMKERGIPVNYSMQDFDEDCRSLRDDRDPTR